MVDKAEIEKNFKLIDSLMDQNTGTGRPGFHEADARIAKREYLGRVLAQPTRQIA